MKKIIDLIKADPRYQKNIEYGQPRAGHPEGKVKFHVADLETNLEILTEKDISNSNYWKLKFIIHVHDSFKAEAQKETPTTHPKNHASLAREYASRFTRDTDLLNMIQFHDENYSLWLEYLRTGSYDKERFYKILSAIKNWNLFLMFIIIDGCTEGKDLAKIPWFIDGVRKHKKHLWTPPGLYRVRDSAPKRLNSACTKAMQ